MRGEIRAADLNLGQLCSLRPHRDVMSREAIRRKRPYTSERRRYDSRWALEDLNLLRDSQGRLGLPFTGQDRDGRHGVGAPYGGGGPTGACSAAAPPKSARVAGSWALEDLNLWPLPCQGTSARFGNPKRSNAYRRIARRRMGFGVFGWVVLLLVGFGCFGLWCADSVRIPFTRPVRDGSASRAICL